MKTAAFMVTWLALAAMPSAAQVHSGWEVCRNPMRVFPGRATVDLAPLFDWWARQPLVVTNKADLDTNAPPEPRPLPAWRLVAGAKLATTGPAWLVDAVIYTSPTLHTNARIVLNNPPAVEEARYDMLKAQLDDLEHRMAAARHDYDVNTNAEARAQRMVQRYNFSWSKLRSDGMAAYAGVAIQKHDAAAAALYQWDQLRSARDQVREQLATIPAVNGVYHIEWFAVLMGRTKWGLPIYDMGLVSATPP